ncbi:hypothetical protein ACIBK8_05455 [Streptomyces sp. NPDC050161]|uniref:hypothetical protein n=1 Tax=Streptomyces sp. NPDC050161 TaxID=3365604 RepID=UPI00379595C2
MSSRRIPLTAALTAVVLTTGMTTTAAQVSGKPAARHAAVAKAPLDHSGVLGETVVVPPFATGTAIARCPEGRQPSGGGGVSEDGGIFLNGSAASGNGWQTYFSNESGVPRTAAAFAVCTQTPHVRVNGPLVEVPALATSPASATCPEGHVVSGGGFRVSGPDGSDLLVANLTPGQANQWFVRAVNNTSELRRVSAYAVCSTAPHSLHAGALVTVQPGRDASATVACPAGQVASGGGGRSTFTGVPRALITSSRALPGGGGWEVRFRNSDDVPRSLIAEVVCTTT